MAINITITVINESVPWPMGQASTTLGLYLESRDRGVGSVAGLVLFEISPKFRLILVGISLKNRKYEMDIILA